MTVVHIGFKYGVNDTGGAAIASTRLHLALLEAGVDSHYVTIMKCQDGPNVHVLPDGRARTIFFALTKLLRGVWRFTSYRRSIPLNVVPLWGLERLLMGELDLKHYQNRHSVKSLILRAVWNVVWVLLFRTTPRGKLFAGWRSYLLRMFGAKIGKGVNVMPSCRIWQPWKLEMGDYSCLSQRVDCYNVDWIRIGAQALVSQDAFLCTASHDISSKILELTTAPIWIGPQAWVCARAIVMPGITVNEGAVVAAGSIVAKDVSPWTVVGGNPAVAIKKRELNG